MSPAGWRPAAEAIRPSQSARGERGKKESKGTLEEPSAALGSVRAPVAGDAQTSGLRCVGDAGAPRPREEAGGGVGTGTSPGASVPKVTVRFPRRSSTFPL